MSKYKVTIERVKDVVVVDKANEQKLREERRERSLNSILASINKAWFSSTESQTDKPSDDEIRESIVIEFDEAAIDEKTIDDQIKALISLNEKGESEETQSEMTAQMDRIVMQELDKRMAEDAARHQV